MLTNTLRLTLLLILLGWLQISQLQVIAHEATHWLHDVNQLCDDLQLVHSSPGLITSLIASPTVVPSPLAVASQPFTQWADHSHRPQRARAPPHA